MGYLHFDPAIQDRPAWIADKMVVKTAADKETYLNGAVLPWSRRRLNDGAL